MLRVQTQLFHWKVFYYFGHWLKVNDLRLKGAIFICWWTEWWWMRAFLPSSFFSVRVGISLKKKKNKKKNLNQKQTNKQNDFNWLGCFTCAICSWSKTWTHNSPRCLCQSACPNSPFHFPLRHLNLCLYVTQVFFLVLKVPINFFFLFFLLNCIFFSIISQCS